MKKIVNQGWNILTSPTIKNTGVVFVGNAVSSILGIVFAFIAAYYLTPEGWGIVASARNLINILIAFADLGLGAVLFQHATSLWKNDYKTAERIYKEILSLRILSVLCFSLILVIFANQASKVAFGFTDTSLIYLTVVGFVGVIFLDFQVFAIQSRQNWTIAAFLIAVTNIFRVGILLFLVWNSQINQLNTLFAFSISGILSAVVSFIFFPHLPSVNFSLKSTIKKFGKFSLWMSTNKIISTVGSRIDVLLVLQILGAYKAGIYGMASTLSVGVPIIIGSFATVLAAKFSSITEKKQLKRFFYRSIGLSAAISVLLLIGVLVTPFVIGFFGVKYEAASSILQWLLIGMIPFTLSTPAVNILIYRFNKPNIISSLSVVQLAIIIFVNIFYMKQLDLYAPVIAAGSANLLTMFVTYFYAFRYLNSYESK